MLIRTEKMGSEILVSIFEEAVRNRILSQLRELGLSTHEAISYTTLLANPRIPASTLCKETGIPDSKIYYALDGLSKRGMIMVQQGTPNLYMALHPKEAIANLKRQLMEGFNEKMKEADVLTDTLSPIYESAESPEEMELAYIIRGQRNIIKKMKDLINSAEREVTVFIPFSEALQEVKESLINAKRRRVKLNIALTEDLLEKEEKERVLTELGTVKLLNCPCCMVVSDMKNLITISNWTEEVAIMTQDQNLMRACREYFDNPKCCA